MRVSYDNQTNVYYVEGHSKETYTNRDIIREFGFRWNPNKKHWETTNLNVVEKTVDKLPFSPEAAQQYKQSKYVQIEKVQESLKIDSDIEVPSPEGLEYRPYQKAAIEYIDNHKHILDADEMGLGKTIEVCGYINLRHPHNVLIICPAIAKLTPWVRELNKWLVHKYKTYVVYGADDFDCGEGTITILNYDILGRNFEILNKYRFDLIVIDESHKLKNPKAMRTQFAKLLQGNKKVLLTGTPILNRPSELFTQLQILEHPLGKNYWSFIYEYCFVQPTGPTGNRKIILPNETKLPELQRLLRSTVMIRRLKSDVLPELPPKVRNLVTFEYTASPEEIALLNKINTMAEGVDFETAIRNLRYDKAFFGEIERVRHEQGKKKVPYIIEYVKNLLENENKVVVFAWHHDVVEGIASAFENVAVITGQTSMSARVEAQNKFQNDPDCHLFVGNIAASGIAIDLFAAQNAVFAELDWTPSNLYQAEDRLHRHGQEGSVFIDYLVTKDSIDTWLGNVIVNKQAVIEMVTESKNLTEIEIKEPEIDNRTIKIDNDWLNNLIKLQDELERVTGIHPSVVIKAAKALDELNTDWASVVNNVGYNKYDSQFGHALCHLDNGRERKYLTEKMHLKGIRMLRKYKYQLLSIFGNDDIEIQKLVNWTDPMNLL